MALLFMDGCEHYITADLAEKYTYVSSQAVSNTRARTGTYSISGGVHGIAVAASGATAIVGYGVYATAGGHYCTVGLGGFASATYAHVSMRVETDGSVTVRNGISSSATILGQTSPAAFRFSMWNYVEIKIGLHDSTGTVTVKVNGTALLTLTGKDTIGTPASATWNAVEWSNGATAWVDDIYLCDGSGGLNDDLLGEVRVVTLLPVTDAVAAGSNADFTCSTSTDHGALVDDAAPNDDTDYVSSSTLNHVDSWEYPALGYTGTIKGVQMSLSARKTDSGTRAIAAVTRPVATNRVHATNHYLGTSYAYWRAIWELNPEDSGAWEVADVDGAEFGVKVTV
jgi:hypothetical protein